MVIQISCPHLLAGDAQFSPDYTRMKTSLSWVPEWNGATCLLPFTLFTFPSLGTFYSSSSRKVPLKTCCFTALDIIFSLVQAPCSGQVGHGPFGMPFMLPLLKSYSFSLFFFLSLNALGARGREIQGPQRGYSPLHMTVRKHWITAAWSWITQIKTVRIFDL